MKTHELFETTSETKELIMSAVETAVDKVGLAPQSVDDYDYEYEHWLNQMTLKVLRWEPWWRALSADERGDLVHVIHKMIRRYIVGLKRQFEK